MFMELREPPEKVREFYLASIKKDPFSEEAHYLFAHWLMRQGSLTEALEHVDQALKLDPKFGQALDLRERSNSQGRSRLHSHSRIFASGGCHPDVTWR